MTSRAGKPCSTGSAAPFIATASSASRPSIAVWIGVPEVKPSDDVLKSWSAPALIPASWRRLRRLAPSHLALPM